MPDLAKVLKNEIRRLARSEAKAAAAPRELVVKTKETIQAVASIDDHDEAMHRELDPQVWSASQPEFEKNLAALKARISSKK